MCQHSSSETWAGALRGFHCQQWVSNARKYGNIEDYCMKFFLRKKYN